MNHTTGVQPRTLVVELNNGRFVLVMPIHRLECENHPPHFHFLIKARRSKMLSFVPVARVTIDGQWLDRPQVEESVLVASYYLPSSRLVDVPADILQEVLNVTEEKRAKLREAYEYNRSLNFSYDTA